MNPHHYWRVLLVHFQRKHIFVKATKASGPSLEMLLQSALFNTAPEHDQKWKVYSDGFCTPPERTGQPPFSKPPDWFPWGFAGSSICKEP